MDRKNYTKEEALQKFCPISTHTRHCRGDSCMLWIWTVEEQAYNGARAVQGLEDYREQHTIKIKGTCGI